MKEAKNGYYVFAKLETSVREAGQAIYISSIGICRIAAWLYFRGFLAFAARAGGMVQPRTHQTLDHNTMNGQDPQL